MRLGSHEPQRASTGLRRPRAGNCSESCSLGRQLPTAETFTDRQRPAIAACNAEAGSVGAAPVLERGNAAARDTTAQAPFENPKRYRVRVTSFRRRLFDEDNLCAKFHVDALRYFGLIPDDSPKVCKIETSQIEVQ